MGLPEISVVICTHNRASLVEACLDSLTHQTVSSDRFEVVVVDNASTDGTVDILRRFSTQFEHFVFVTEPRIGVSYTRNRGVACSSPATAWIAALDDDTEVFPDWMEEMLKEVKHGRFDAFGGLVLPKHLTPPPVWFHDRYASSEFISPVACAIPKGPFFFIGCNCAYRKEPLQAIGGFPERIGPQGQAICYGDETFAQNRMHRAGYRLGYVPDVKAYHVVRSGKYSIRFFVRSAFSMGRDSWPSMEDRPTAAKLMRILLAGLFGSARACACIWQLVVPARRCYPANLAIDAISPLSWMAGAFAGAWTYRYSVRKGKKD